MSRAHDRLKRDKKKARPPEEKKIDRQLKQGKIPRALLSNPESKKISELRRKPRLKKYKGKMVQIGTRLDWTFRSTKAILLGKDSK